MQPTLESPPTTQQSSPHRLLRNIRLRSDHAPNLRPVSWLELFFDLIFVAAIAQVGTPLSHDYSLSGLARYTFLFFLIWWAWLGHSMYSTRFETDDTLQRLLTLLQIFAAAIMAANAGNALSSRDSAGFGAAYAVMRIVLVAQYIRARRLDGARSLATIYATGFGFAAMLWVAAAFFDTPARFYVWTAALLIDLATPWFAVEHTHKLPPDAAHLPERFGLFTIILLGESVTAVMHGIESQEGWFASAAISAFVGLALAFGYWWWYFDRAHGADERHVRTKRQTSLFQLWSYTHFPLYLSIAVVGVGVEHLIALPEAAHPHADSAWILLGAATVLMLALNTIALTSESRGLRDASGAHIAARYLLSMVPLFIAPFAVHLAPWMLVVALALFCAAQIILPTRQHVSGTIRKITPSQAVSGQELS